MIADSLGTTAINEPSSDLVFSMINEDETLPKSIGISRPNFFVALRLSQLEKIVSRIQNKIKAKCPELSRCMTSPKKVHLTFFVMELRSIDQINNAVTCFYECKEDLRELFPRPLSCLKFSRLNTFGRKVLFVAPSDSATLQKLNIFVRRCYDRFLDAGLVHNNSFNYKPHATIAKLSADRKLNRKARKQGFQLEHCDGLEEELSCGVDCDLVDVDLLSMSEHAEDGYYKSYGNIKFE